MPEKRTPGKKTRRDNLEPPCALFQPPPSPPQDVSAAEVARIYGDRIRRAPAVVNAGRHKSNRQAARATAAAAVYPQGGVLSATEHGFDDRPASRKGGPTAAESGGAAPNGVDGVTPVTVASGAGNGAAVGGEAVGRSAGGTGLYQPRTSGRSVGGSLGKRFTDDQVGILHLLCLT